jgi:lipid-binding SYLF domain-containing protein
MNMKMERIIERCDMALDEAATKTSISGWVWKTCKGVAIITVSETGFVFSISDGDGVVIKKNDDGTWGAPSALMFTGTAAGAIFGKATKQIFLFPMTELGLKMLCGQTTAQLGVQMGIAAGPHGREAAVGANIGGKGADITYAYTLANGAMINVGFNDHVINAANEVNADFYGKVAEPLDIVMTPGTVKVPTGKGVEEMCEKLAALSKM